MWGGGQEMLLGEDFDLNSIPPIELGNTKFQDDLNYHFESSASMQDYGHSHEQYGLQHEQYPQSQHTQESFDGPFFGDMMSGHGF